MITPNEPTDPFPFGLHKEKQFADVPAEYLYKISKAPWINDWPRLKAYLDKHMDGIEKDVRNRGLID